MIRLICILLILCSSQLHAEFINIGILSSNNIQSLAFSVRAGKYSLFTERGKVKEFDSGSKITIRKQSTGVEVLENGRSLGVFQKVNLMGTGWYNHFMIKSLQPPMLEKRYDDNLRIKIRQGRLLLINNIDLDNYVAGVVEAEVGRKPPKEYFKLQAIICRTYALSNTHKHLQEGFNLCDQVHCQAYHGKSFYPAIVDASMQTRGAVIVDSDIQLITAAFHSNCGGQTVNSEDVWTKSLYYLRSVQDTFCLDKRNSFWEKEIDIPEWKRFLTAKNSNIADSIPTYYQAEQRENDFLYTQISFEEFRHHFRLRSTYFNVYPKKEKVVLKGRGYGHGVGLCQEGAMEMAAQGYTYAEILHYYYSGVHIIDLAALDFFKEE